MIPLMKRAEELSRAIRASLKAHNYKQEVLAPVVGKSRQMVNKKLNLKSPFTYEEVVRISEFLGTPDLPGDSDGMARNVRPEPGPRYLIDLLSQLPASDRRKFYHAAVLILRGFQRPKAVPKAQWQRKLEILEIAAKGR